MEDDEILEGELVDGEEEEVLSEQVQSLISIGLVSEEIDIFDIDFGMFTD